MKISKIISIGVGVGLVGLGFLFKDEFKDFFDACSEKISNKCNHCNSVEDEFTEDFDDEEEFDDNLFDDLDKDSLENYKYPFDKNLNKEEHKYIQID